MAFSSMSEVLQPGFYFNEKITLFPPEAVKLFEDGIYTLDSEAAVVIDVDSDYPWYIHFVQSSGTNGVVSNLTADSHYQSEVGSPTVIKLLPGTNEIYFANPGFVTLQNFMD
jgi:hypothetical protein